MRPEELQRALLAFVSGAIDDIREAVQTLLNDGTQPNDIVMVITADDPASQTVTATMFNIDQADGRVPRLFAVPHADFMARFGRTLSVTHPGTDFSSRPGTVVLLAVVKGWACGTRLIVMPTGAVPQA